MKISSPEEIVGDNLSNIAKYMKKIFKKIIKKFFKLLGLNLTKNNPANNPEQQTLKVLDILNINTILDIGANEGQFANQIRELGYKGKIISFEPLSSARRKLIQLAEKDNKWIVYKQCAVGDKDGNINFNISGNSVSSSALTMLKSHSSASPHSVYVGSENVPVVKLDSIIDEILGENINLFIKIDTQGYEKKVFDGAKNVLHKVSGIICELSLVPLYEDQHLWRDVIEHLESNGFILWGIQKGFTNPNTGQSLQMDGIFLRKEKIVLTNL